MHLVKQHGTDLEPQFFDPLVLGHLGMFGRDLLGPLDLFNLPAFVGMLGLLVPFDAFDLFNLRGLLSLVDLRDPIGMFDLVRHW